MLRDLIFAHSFFPYSSFQPHQDVARDLKLLDAAFHCSVAPYIRSFPVNHFTKEGARTPTGVAMVRDN